MTAFALKIGKRKEDELYLPDKTRCENIMNKNSFRVG
jgi:hypothetical protein